MAAPAPSRRGRGGGIMLSRMRTKTRMNGRPHIGFVLASLHTGASADVWPSVADEAERADVNLFCFPGGRVGLREGHEASRNFVFELAASGPLDGLLLWASSLSGGGSLELLEGFMRGFRDLPAVALSAGAGGMPAVTIDYYDGMAQILAHAIEAHGYRELAFLRGPAAHHGAQERYRAYLDGLAARGMALDERLVASPAGWDAGDAAMLELLDGRGLVPGRDFRAVVAASDLMALRAQRTLQARGYRVPEDAAVFGMNDSVESRLAAPPLTTVHGPFDRLGAEGLRSLLAAIGGTELPPLRRLPAALVLRRSCGCPSASFLLAGEQPAGEAAPPGEGLAAAIRSVVGGPSRVEDEWIRPLLEAWEAALGPGAAEAEGRFFDLLGRLVDRLIRAGAEVGPWQGAVSLLRRSSLASAGAARRARIEDLAGRARVLVAEGAERAMAMRAWEEDRRADELRALDHELLMAMDMGRLSRTLSEALPRLGIMNACLCLYDEGEEGMARLAFCLRDGKEIEGFPGTFPAEELAPPGALPERRFSFVVEPLFFHDSRIGHALLELGPRKGSLYEELRGSISGALRSVILFGKVEEARARAERADEIKTHLLSNVSHELRAPVNIVLGCLDRIGSASPGLPAEAAADLERARSNVEHELSLVNDLLDLSRAEMDELDVSREPVDLGPILSGALSDFAAGAAGRGEVEWRSRLPERLPLVMADKLRIKQVVYNLLGNARKFTERGSITLSAEVVAPNLVIEVSDTGRGIAADRLPHIFEPFLSAQGGSGRSGAGLGLSITRHLVALHFGSIEARSEEGKGSSFRVMLPLPSLEGRLLPAEGRLAGEAAPGGDCLLVVSSRAELDPELEALAARCGLAPRRVGLEEVEAGGLDAAHPRAIAWDLAAAGRAEWSVFRKIRQKPALNGLPFIVLGAEGGQAAFAAKGAASLLEAIMLSCPQGGDAPILVADDDPEARAALRKAIGAALPGLEVVEAPDGAAAWELLAARRPRLAVLDLVMPSLTGIDLVERMRADERFLSTPVLLLTNKVVTMEDVRRLEGRSRVVLQNKGIWDASEAGAGISRLLHGEEPVPEPTSAIAKRTVAYLNANYAANVTRWKLAEAVNASEDYVSRVFHRELGLTPWEYLTRLRVQHAKELLRASSRSVASVAEAVGFSDQAYFSRVFKKAAGTTPQAYRESSRP